MATLLRSSRQLARQGVSKFGPPSPLQLAGQTSKARDGPRNNFAVGGPPPTRRLTQEDQNKADEEKQREAIDALVQIWLERLQLISVITTFFAATEAGLLGKTIPSPTEILSRVGQLSNICLMGALVVHAHAAIISFLGAFFLIRYKLTVAEEEEKQAEIEMVNSRTSISSIEKGRDSTTSPYADNLQTNPVPGLVRVNSLFSGDQTIWSTAPHLVQLGPFQRQPPTELLARCHSLCLLLSSLGFLLALIGILSYAWDRLSLSISVFATASMGFCLVSVILILITPSTKTSHIYYNRKSR
ncbi:hypothetical protein BYT27DRAFT_7126189 [Phlegmacium glaucopus]|nr:hypothetical protein BYT27DRAFT_7126189 [Phlegmacium glaucopus]